MKPRARKENIVVQNTANETLVYDLGTNKALVLNETSAFIWNLCDGNRDILQIQNEVSKQFKQSTSEDFIWFAIEQLKKDKLIENGDKLTNRFQGKNRREVIKQIGLSTMISLPFISSVVAPKAANATSNSSCVPESNICVENNFTQSNCCSGLRCLIDDCIPCRTSSSLPYVQFNSLAECQTAPARSLCCNSSAPVTFVPASLPFSTVGSCFCG